MKYIDNIKVNYKKNLINFYEWNNKDNIKLLDKVLCVKLGNNDYINIANNKIIIDIINEKNVIFCTDYDTIAICFDKNGKSLLYSKLSLEDEFLILSIMRKEKISKIGYTIISSNNYSLFTRDRNNKLNSIIKYLNNSSEDILKFISLECFNDIYNKEELYKKIRNSNELEIDNIYKTIKLLCINSK